MGAFASGSGWFRLPGGYIVQFGTFSGNSTRFISGHFPIPFPNRHCCKVSDEAAFCLIQRPYISKTLLT
ncbi:gp53-like domain-containing protein, partial [Escherichia coli]